jgi:hypothetical protein
MATVTALQIRRTDGGETARLRFPVSRGLAGAMLFLLIAFFLLAAGAATGAPPKGGAPVEAGAFVLDPSIATAQAEPSRA